MSKASKDMLSLGRAVEILLGAPSGQFELSSSLSAEAAYGRGLFNWFRLVHLAFSNTLELRHNFTDLLSSAQNQSFRLLWEWWTAQYNDPGLCSIFIAQLYSKAGGIEPILNELRFASSWNDSVPPPKGKSIGSNLKQRGLARAKQGPQSTKTNYHEYAEQLFFSEFCSHGSYRDYDNNDNFLTDLAQQRQYLCESACVQLKSVSIYLSMRNSQSKTPLPADLNQTWPNYVDVEDRMPWYPSAADSPIITICPWLKKFDKTLDNAPYYLWDVNAQKTVKVADLPAFPDYTAISHTWGRYIDTAAGKAKLRGVPWRIFRNMMFSVDDLPVLLDQLPTMSPYVWFDLVCIPQDNLTGPIAKREIARQALIFQNAVHAVAWLNEIENLDNLNTVTRWLCLQMSQFENESQEERDRQRLVAETWNDLESASTGLLTLDDKKAATRQLVSNRWSTSLWTLQEACLRPDMWVCSKDFEYLTSMPGVYISISSLVTIFTAFHQHFYIQNERDYISLVSDINHPALWELQCWLTLSGLDKLTGMTQIDVLVLGDRRTCTELKRRAEAIMSAIGAEQWYTNTDPKSPGNELLFAKYPLNFVRETCAKDPGRFFGAYLKSKLPSLELQARDDSDRDIEPEIRGVEQQEIVAERFTEGSLLPFGREACFCTNIGTFNVGLSAHNSVNSWTITSNGAVTISQACVLSSPQPASLALPQRPINPKAVLFGAMLDTSLTSSSNDANEPAFKIDLHEFVKAFPRPIYAIIVLYRRFVRGNIQGILAQGVFLEQNQSATDDGHQRFMKVGNFGATWEGEAGLDIPETASVKWIVL